MDYSTDFRDVLRRYDHDSQVVTSNTSHEQAKWPKSNSHLLNIQLQEIFLSIHVLSNFV